MSLVFEYHSLSPVVNILLCPYPTLFVLALVNMKVYLCVVFCNSKMVAIPMVPAMNTTMQFFQGTTIASNILW